MKILRVIAAAFAGALLLFSCSEQKEEEQILQRGLDQLNFGYSAGEKPFVIKSNRAWKAETDASWITVTPPSGEGSSDEQTLTVSVAENEEGARDGKVQIISGEKSFTLIVRQEDGYFYFDAAQIPNTFEKGVEISGVSIVVPYHKAKNGYKMSVTPTLEGEGAAGITVATLSNAEVNPGEGSISIPVSGTPTAKGDFTVKLHVEIAPSGLTREIECASRVRLAGEVSVAAFKVLPRLAVFDWGEYAKGSGTNGAGDAPRSFLLQLRTKDGKVLRQQDIKTANWFISPTIFFRKNRYAMGGLDPDTDYVFRIIARELGADKEDSDPTDLEFHTPAETIPAGAIVYKDFDDWWVGGCSIYQAFSSRGPAAENSWFRYNPDLSAAETKAREDLLTANPCYGVQKLLNYATSTGGWVTSDTCPLVWNFYWEGDKWGTNYGDENYPGWQALINGSKGDVRHMCGAVLLGVNGSNPGWLRTPKFASLGSETATVTLTVNTAPYVEPCSYEADLTHFIRVVGPGKIVDGGASLYKQNSDTEIEVQCASNIDPDTKDYNRDYTIPTTHKVRIEGATAETRVEICGGNGTKPMLIVDDILVVKN